MAHQERKLRTKGSVWEPAAVFLTAARVDAKALNKYLLYLQDWEFADDAFNDSQLVLLTSTTLPSKIHSPSVPPLSVPKQNDFTNFTLDAINTFVRTHEPDFQAVNLHTTLWLIIDQIGLDNLTCILVEQGCETDYETGEPKSSDQNLYRAVRLPCEEVHGMFANLSIANMGFEDFVLEDEGVQSDGLYRPNGLTPVGEEVAGKREASLKALQKLGHL